MIYGIGVDLVNIERLQKMQERWGERFLERVFTPDETKYCLQYSFSARHLAAVFAAKEAVSKALGTGLSLGIGWQDIQIKSTKGHPPQVKLSGVAARIAKTRGIGNILISLSHDTDYAIAQAIALKDSA